MHHHFLLSILWAAPFVPGLAAAPTSGLEGVYRNYLAKVGRRDDPKPVDDLSWISKWAAVGDSYAAGIGAGTRINWWCSRYDHSYPNLINADERMSGSQKFEDKTCSGAEIAEVLDQVNSLPGGQDVITISVGGNDVGFADILNECVYTFWPKEVGCDNQLNMSLTMIQNHLPGKLQGVYEAAKGKLAPGGRIYVTGYAHFWDDTTTDCDSVSWHWYIWPFYEWAWQYLTQDRRKRMNQLVDAMNDQIGAAAKSAGDQFTLVLYDYYFGEFNGRFCMPGVKEPAPNRFEVLFYNNGANEVLDVASADLQQPGATNSTVVAVDDRKIKKRGLPIPVPPGGAEDDSTVPANTFEGQILQMMIEGEKLAIANGIDPNDPAFSPGKIFSDNWLRVFHPNAKGQSIIANKVIYHLVQDHAGAQFPEVVEFEGTCPAPPPTSSPPDTGGNPKCTSPVNCEDSSCNGVPDDFFKVFFHCQGGPYDGCRCNM